jgi:hypothetical protein
VFQYNGRRFLLDIDTGRIMVADVGSTTWVTDTLTKSERYAATSALIAEHKAMTYVWGRQDAGESEHDTDISIAFGAAYGRHAYRYRIGDHHCMINIARAYDAWRTGGLEPSEESW